MERGDVHETLRALTTAQKVALAILAAKEVCRSPEFLDWADAWLEERDRTWGSATALVQKLTPVPIVATVDRPASLTPPKLSANAWAAATYAAQAASMMKTLPGGAEDKASQACESAKAESAALDLVALAELARKSR